MTKYKLDYAFEETHNLSSLDIFQFMKNERPLLILACISLTFFATQQSKDTSLLEKIQNAENGVCFRFYMSVLTGWFHKKWNCIWYKVVSNFHKKKWISGRSRNLSQRSNLPVRIVEIFQHIKASSFLLATWEWYTPDRDPNMIDNLVIGYAN